MLSKRKNETEASILDYDIKAAHDFDPLAILGIPIPDLATKQEEFNPHPPKLADTKELDDLLKGLNIPVEPIGSTPAIPIDPLSIPTLEELTK